MTTFTSSTAFDLVDFDTPHGADDLISSLTPSLLTKDTFQADERVGDSPDSYVSNSSEEANYTNASPIEDFDLYDFGANANEFENNGEPFKFSGSQQQDMAVDSFLKGFTQDKAKSKTFNNVTLKQSPMHTMTPANVFPQQVITPQQIQEQFLLLQQQQRAQLLASAYNAQMPFGNPFMNPYATHLPTFIASSPSPPPVTSPSPVQETKPVVKQQTATKKKKKTSNKRPRETNNSSPSEALAELETKKTGSPDEDKEIKRQRRLIKNRESAQASRERKKLYVKGLEAKVEELTNKNSSLTSKLAELEEENRKLRERLVYFDPTMQMQDYLDSTLEPDAKKRRLTNMPVVAKPVSNFSYNPFDSNFWAFLGQPQVQTSAPQVPVWQPVQSKRVVMFVMIFCVAMMMVLPKDHLSSTLISSAVEEQQQSLVTSTDSSINRASLGRNLLTAHYDDVPPSENKFSRLKDLYDQFGRLASVKSEIMEDSIDANPIKLSLQLNQTANSLQISIPLESLLTTPATKPVIKEEPKDDEPSNETCPANTLESLTKELLQELREMSA